MIRGKVLGGSSSLNHMTWNRASNDYWDNFGRLVDDPGWSWSGVERYYDKVQRLVFPPDEHDDSKEVIPSAHGRGPVQISTTGFHTNIDQRVLNSTRDGSRYSFNPDSNAGDMVGIAWLQSSITSRGERSSASTAYLHSSVLHRKNLDVVVNARAVKLSSSQNNANRSDGSRKIRIDTVEITNTPDSPRRKITAAKEIILSSGAFNTPHLLLLSGIGSQADLANPSLNIPVLVNSPGVGKHLADHPLLPNYWLVADNNTFDDVTRYPDVEERWIKEWQKERKGIMVMPHAGNTLGFFRHPEGFRGGEDPSSGKRSGNTEMIYLNGWAEFGQPVPRTGNYLTILTSVVSVTSLGQVTLRSSNPFDPPVINPNIFSTPYDIDSMVQVMKDAEDLLNFNATDSPWKDYIISKLNPFTTDAERADYARNNSVSISHGSGTVRMGSQHDHEAPVDSSLRVKGVKGLRVVDASVFPKIPECHPQAVVYVIAEKAADLIKEDHKE
ncbi:hypothetical protein E1B28_007721 [Marasmius oreades]|nr:uncharacterized protein E1B28_007721 [Marasmius oreades]KAG7094104.1 hypothetical protein E1B28_007721 [Marasmius oreades]